MSIRVISGYHKSENVVNILSVNSILVSYDTISSKDANGKHKTKFSLFFRMYLVDKITESPRNVVYLLVVLDKINKMETTPTDQNGKQFNLRGENLRVRLHLGSI